jgi:membrane protease YdiL (CAAX protease family)
MDVTLGPNRRIGSASLAPFSFLPRQPISARTAIWSLLLGMSLVTPATLLASAFPVRDLARDQLASVGLMPGIAFLKHVVLGPLLEEIVYRGLFLQLARRYLRTAVAVALSSIAFGATHFPGGLPLMLLAGTMGVVLASIALRSGSLYASFLAHAGFNFTAGFIIMPVFDLAARLQSVPPGARMIDATRALFPIWWIVLWVFVSTIAVIMLSRESTAPRRR